MPIILDLLNGNANGTIVPSQSELDSVCIILEIEMDLVVLYVPPKVAEIGHAPVIHLREHTIRKTSHCRCIMIEDAKHDRKRIRNSHKKHALE
jgi:hypothetical protein